MSKKIIYATFITLVFSLYTEGVAQIAINSDGTPASANTILDLNPAVGKAFVPPKMTWAQIKAISPASEGMIVYDTEFKTLCMYNGSKWIRIAEQTSVSGFPANTSVKVPSSGVSFRNITTDASNNVYIIGTFNGTATFTGLTPITSSTGYDNFILKYDNSGIAQWVKNAGEDNGGVNGITTDASGNVYITSTIGGAGPYTFAPLPPIYRTGNFNDLIVAKYNSNGEAQWVQTAGGGSNCLAFGHELATDAAGNVYVIGRFSGTINFPTSPITTFTTTAPDKDIFVAKFNTNGVAQWARQVGGTDLEFAGGITVNSLGDVYITGGFYSSTITFATSPISTTLSNMGNEDIFIVKYNSSGTVLWAKSAGSNSNDYGSDIVIDASDNAYIVGAFYNTVTFNTLPITTLNSVGLNDVFVAKYNSSGVAQWAKQAGSGGGDSGQGIAIDAAANIYVTGYFENNATFASPSLSVTSAGFSDVFVAKYNTNGTPLWVQRAGGTNTDVGVKLCPDVLGNIYTIGAFTPSAQFGNQTLTVGSNFLMKYSE